MRWLAASTFFALAACSGSSGSGSTAAPTDKCTAPCQPLDQCHAAGTCDPATGQCSNPPRPDGAACDDGNVCTANDACTAGACAGTPIANCGSGPPPGGFVIDPTVAPDLFATTQFLYTGPNPVQTGVLAGTIDRLRVAVLRGKVLTRDGAPLAGAAVSILGHPEYGRTASGQDGVYDLVVNGGGPLTLSIAKDGYLSAHRIAQAPWRDFAWADDVALVPLDAKVTAVSMGAGGAQVARGSQVTDADGTRTATLVVPPGTQAAMILPSGAMQPVDALHLRATEFTVGPGGRIAMPAALGPQIAYTYAVELSADEVDQAGATSVQFNAPVPFYLDNFLKFPAGTLVPAGSYDRTRAVWVPEASGLVVTVLGTTGALADLDVTGAGTAASAAELAAIGITDAERAQLSTLYAAGASLWRVPIRHLTPWDCNWPFGLPGDATPPNPKPSEAASSGSYGPTPDPNRKPCQGKGSSVECQNQVLGERLPVAGTSLALHYTSSGAPGAVWQDRAIVPVSGASVPASLARIEVRASLAGRLLSATFPPLPNQSYTLSWDGRDAYGRLVSGVQTASVEITYVYPATYDRSLGFGSYGTGVAVVPEPARSEIYLTTVEQILLGHRDLRGALGGWEIGIHHLYDPSSRILYSGDGDRRSAAGAPAAVLSVVAGGGTVIGGDGGPATNVNLGWVQGIAIAPDGSFFLASETLAQIRRIDRSGTITTVAGTGTPGYGGDGGPATAAQLDRPRGLALGSDGSLFVADAGNHRIRLVTPSGVISTVAGTGAQGAAGDGGVATAAQLNLPSGVALGPDGSLYIADFGNHLVRRVDPSGVISTIAGGGSSLGDGGPGPLAQLVPWSIAVDARGSVYVGDPLDHRVRRIDPTGMIRTYAGTGTVGLVGDGGPAALAQVDPRGVAVGPDGSVFISDVTGSGSIRRIDPSGIIRTVAGSQDSSAYDGNGAFATQTRFSSNEANGAVAVDAGGRFYFGGGAGWVRRADSALPGVSLGSTALPSEDGSEVFLFDPDGRHLRTHDALTGAVTWQFGYDAAGKLTQITDRGGNVTTITYDASGPSAIVGPYGHRTSLAVDANGFLSGVTDPAGGVTRLSSDAGGLLAQLVDAAGGTHQFGYDGDGRLVRDQDAAGGVTTLARTVTATGHTVAVTAPSGAVTTFAVEVLRTRAVHRVRTDPWGGVTDLVVGADGVRDLTNPDGSKEHLVPWPDPRWGMEAPIAATYTFTPPGGAPRTRTMTREVTLAAPGNVLALQSLTDTLFVAGVQVRSTSFQAGPPRVRQSTSSGTAVVTLDALGRVASFAPPGGGGFTTSYDARGRVSQVAGAAGIWTWTWAYDAQGRIQSRTDAAGGVTRFAYDAADRLTGVSLPSGATLAYTRDALGRRTRTTLPSGAVHAELWTPEGLPASYAPPASPAFTSTWDVDGRLAGVSLPSGRTQAVTLDASGLLAGITWPEASVAVQRAAGDTTGRPATLRWMAGAGAAQDLSFSYFAGDLPQAVTLAGPASGVFTYSWDDQLRLASLDVAAAGATEQLAIVRDGSGHPTQIGGFTLLRGGPRGQATSISDGTLAVDLAYDDAGRVTSRATHVGTQAVFSEQLSYDAAGRISVAVETAGATSHTLAFAYDADGHLLSVTQDGVAVEQYAYDANGNRTSRRLGGAAEAAAYDAQDRIVALGAVAYSFGPDGFLASRGADTFVHDAHGELLSAVAGGQPITFGYDALERRVTRADAGGTTQLLYGNPDRDTELTATVSPAGVLTRYVYDDGGRLLAIRRAGVQYGVAVDHLGSPRAVVDAAGSVVKAIAYDRYGNVTADSNPAFELVLGFAGGVRDPVTGLLRFGVRDYDPAAGRWITRDPALFQGRAANLYAYVGGDPVNVVDPVGAFALGASAYDGVGGGVKLGITSKGISFCAELGFGVGSSVDVDFNGDLDDDKMFTELQIKGGAGPVSVEGTLDLDECDGFMRAKPKGKICFAFGCLDEGVNPVESGSLPIKEDVHEANKAWKAPSLEGKISGVVCAKGEW